MMRRSGTGGRGVRGRAGSWMAGMAVLAAGAALFAARPAAGQEINLGGMQLWNVDYWGTYNINDFMGPNFKIKELKPISLSGCRNAAFSGCVVVTCSTAPITGLKVTPSELKSAEGKVIPVSRIQIRYPELAREDNSYAPPHRFDRMQDAAPEEVAMADIKAARGWKPKTAGPVAMQPIWITVNVPADAAPGDYKGQLTIDSENNKVPVVPVNLTVADWAMPDPHQYTLQNIGWMSPERVALFTETPMWSDKHAELIGRSLKMMLPLGSRAVEINLVKGYMSRDNNETMVKWLKQADGSFKYDFTALDKFLDAVAKAIGKPFPVQINAVSSEGVPESKDKPAKGSQHPVVVVNPDGSEAALVPPPHGSAESEAFWKPVFLEIKARLEKRGWADVAGVNWHQYCGGPTPEVVSMFHRIWPGLKWTDTDHGRRIDFAGVEAGLKVPTIVQTTVWQEGAMAARGYKGKLKPGVAYGGHARNRHSEASSLWDMRAITEEQIMKGNHGLNPLGGDLWMAQDERGRWRSGAWSAAALGPANCTKAILGPSAEGAVATERYEALREGVQICEAILFIQKGLDSGKLPADLATRANAVLDERGTRIMSSWVVGDKSGKTRFDTAIFSEKALERETELFAVAAAVAKVAR